MMKKFWTGYLIPLFGVVGMVVVAAGPAGAKVPDPTVGAGAGTGWEYPPTNSPCGLPTSGVSMSYDQFELDHTGTYVGAPATPDLLPVGVATYDGPTHVSITVDANVAAPQGVAPGGCGGPVVVPNGVNITNVVIRGTTTTGGSVSCDGVTNVAVVSPTYTRVTNAVAFVFTTNCTISSIVPGLGTVTNAVPVTHTITGTMNPCILVPPVGIPTNPECDALGHPEAGSHLITSYQAVAVQPI